MFATGISKDGDGVSALILSRRPSLYPPQDWLCGEKSLDHLVQALDHDGWWGARPTPPGAPHGEWWALSPDQLVGGLTAAPPPGPPPGDLQLVDPIRQSNGGSTEVQILGPIGCEVQRRTGCYPI